MIRVILVDDHAIVRHGVRRLLDEQADMRVVAEVDDGAAVVDTVRATECDVLVLDLSLPHRGGLDILAELRETAPRLRVVVLSMYPEDQLALHLLRAGASAYLNKQRDPAELLAAIRRVAAGGRYLTETLADLALVHRDGGGAGPPHHTLTARERQVFFLLIEGHGISEVAAELELSASTVSNHVAAIKEKLGAGSVCEIVRYASRVGLV